tara:strand:- start:84 stop:1397 length:1314 start_codon:yes stop_codon:yes gene_type:complete
LLLLKKMIEIINIIFVFFTFLTLTFFPINIFNPKLIVNTLDIRSMNLLINLSILLILSLLPFSIIDHIPLIGFFVLVYVIFIYKNYSQNFFNKIFIIENTLLLVIFFILASDILNQLYLEWDGQKFYLIKSLIFTQGGTFSDLKNFEYNYFHPHLGQYFWAFFSKTSLLEEEVFGRLFYLFMYCFSVFLISSKIKFKNNSYLLVYLLLILLTYEYSRFSGLQEVLIFSLLIISSINLFNLHKNKKSLFDFLQYILILNLLIWIKAEAFVYSFMLVTLLLFSPINNNQKIISCFSLIGFVIFKYFLYYISDFSIDSRPDSYGLYYVLNLDIFTILKKLKVILMFMFYYILTNEFIILSLLTMILIFSSKGKVFMNIKFTYFFLSLNLIFLTLVYLTTNLDTEYAMRTTTERLIFSTSGFYLIVVVQFLNNLNYKFLNK